MEDMEANPVLRLLSLPVCVCGSTRSPGSCVTLTRVGGSVFDSIAEF